MGAWRAGRRSGGGHLALSLFVALLAGASCSKLGPTAKSGPLGAEELATLSGTLYFVRQHGESPVVHRLRPGASAPVAVTSTSVAAFPYGASPDGRHLALVELHEESDDIVLVRPDGGELRRIASSEGKDWYPRFSPDGAWILFESSRASFRDLYKVPVAGGEVVRLTDNPEGNFDPAWSPDGKQIAFASSRFGQLDVFVMDADGANQRRLTQHPGDSIKPAWSPDGRFIAFVSGRDGRDDLFVIRPDGEGIRNLTAGLTRPPEGPALKLGAEVEESFAWHPKAPRVAFTLRIPRRSARIYVADAASGALTPLSEETALDNEPAWSPDGEHLAFTATVEGQPDVWIMRADGRRRTRLTSGEGGAWLPRWPLTREGGS